MATGRLYNSYDGQFLAEIDYQCYDDNPQSWWGELTLTEYSRLKDGDGYLIELADGRKGRCFLKKKVNRAVYGLSPLFCYRFTGNGLLE
jgi:hypothetical protein